ncbi:MAG: hypothetical protein A3A51_03785 [Candidatus Levybacteria bacterium RIFCSPLOWO2_01_FULL_39_10]|nr:MAG: hypothetical protein A3A51_03785 [Candidatus Levybacteria bacterium RIFCSPLOWO2_01_FULL_39_10]
MRKIKYGLLTILLLIPLFLVSSQQTQAQLGQIWETIVGNPPEGEPAPGPGGDDGLGPGEFKPPFKCGLSYVNTTYPGHTYAVDFNRAPYPSAEDRGDPVRVVADGKVVMRINECGQIVLSHDGGYESWYGHMRNITVNKGDRVQLGQKIGEISDVAINKPGECTATGVHLHAHHMRYGNYVKLAYQNNMGVIEPNPWSLPDPDRLYEGEPPRVYGQCP